MRLSNINQMLLASLFINPTNDIHITQSEVMSLPRVLPQLGQYINLSTGRHEDFVSMRDAVHVDATERRSIEKLAESSLDTVIKIPFELLQKSAEQGNCYNFVTSTMVKSDLIDSHPGGLVDFPQGMRLSLPQDCAKVNGILLQSPFMREQMLTGSCEPGERKILLFASEQQDVHFVALGENGVYYDKPGGMPARETPLDFIKNGFIPIDKRAVVLISNRPEQNQVLLDLDTKEYHRCPGYYCYDVVASVHSHQYFIQEQQTSNSYA